MVWNVAMIYNLVASGLKWKQAYRLFGQLFLEHAIQYIEDERIRGSIYLESHFREREQRLEKGS